MSHRRRRGEQKGMSWQQRELSTQNEDEASVFWGRNANSRLIGNRAAGAQLGNGFHCDIEHLNTTSFPRSLTGFSFM
jgi:hypothetical protein